MSSSTKKPSKSATSNNGDYDNTNPDITFNLESDPYKRRDGDEQGAPLTLTEIQEGIEDESGTVADVEIDGDRLADIGF